MRSRVVTKVISAAAGALIAELTNLALDKIGLSEEKSRVARAILKASVAAASGVLLGAVLSDLDEKEADSENGQQPGPMTEQA
jgi:hypothetical protein